MSQIPGLPRLLPPRAILPELQDRNQLPAGIEASPVCVDRVGDEDLVAAAFEAGINFFLLTADLHWPRYENTRRGLSRLFERGAGIRDEVVVGVVCHVTQPEFCHAPFMEVVEAVPGLKRVDLAIAGAALPHEICNRLWGYDERHRRQGYLGCRSIGVSFEDRRAALLITNHGLADVSFIRYHAADPSVRRDFLPLLAADRKTLIYGFDCLQGYLEPARFDQLGLEDWNWQPRPADHYRFALTRPEIDGILCPLPDEDALVALADALARGPLDEQEEEHVIALASRAAAV